MPENTPGKPVRLARANVAFRSRFYGALWGAFIGDALGAPSHGYYNREQLKRDYGQILTYMKPQLIHPESILHKIPEDRFHPDADVRHGKADLWRHTGTHYHHGLDAGDNTLPLLIMREMCESLAQTGGLNIEDFRNRLHALCLIPGRHKDLVVPEPWRSYFLYFGEKKPPEMRTGASPSLAGLLPVLPVMLFYAGDKQAVWDKSLAVIKMTQSAPIMEAALILLQELLEDFCANKALNLGVAELTSRGHPFLAGKALLNWAAQKRTDEDVASHELRCGSPVDQAFPLAIFLALKYLPNVSAALLANANLGGATPYRGALMGALIGADYGLERIPASLATGLADFQAIDNLIDRLWEARAQKFGESCAS